MTPRSAIKAEQAAKRSDDFINKDYGVGLSLDQLKADVSGVRSALTDEVSQSDPGGGTSHGALPGQGDPGPDGIHRQRQRILGDRRAVIERAAASNDQSIGDVLNLAGRR